MTSVENIIKSIKENPIEKTGEIYHPIPFDEFKDLTPAVNQTAVNHKYNLIRSALPYNNLNGLKVLDVGANAGFFSYKLAQESAHVDAVESSERYCSLGNQVVSHYDVDVTWHHQDISTEFLLGKKYNIALVLSVFQWISQGNDNLDNAKIILNDIAQKSDYLLFELGCNWGTSGIKVKGLALPWIINLLQENTPYSKIKYLGTTRLWGGRSASWRFNRYLFCCTNLDVKLTSWQKFVNYILRLQ